MNCQENNRLLMFLIMLITLIAYTVLVYSAAGNYSRLATLHEVVEYCKADGMYLQKGLVIECAIGESKLGKQDQNRTY